MLELTPPHVASSHSQSESSDSIIDENGQHLKRVSTELYKPLLSPNQITMGRATLLPPMKAEPFPSFIDFVSQSNFHVVPLIAIDFSLANMTFTDNLSLHSTRPEKQNDYRDLIGMISASYTNVLHIPIFGYGAKTCSKAA